MRSTLFGSHVLVADWRHNLNPLTPKPAITVHATSILVRRISAGYCSESGEKAVRRVVIKGSHGVEIRDERSSIHIFHPRSEEKRENGVGESISPIH
ncbi:hypothetical protein AVEN_227810-1 [Araneus ventricosus]|uniref:Uncharacterized protein n=1 Tax=Araneus ventricosus TaxID=182803 RepID=A0A4Y2IQD6_ARAVE|nr:hypothetical protein AVEN_227810-1 [Araneus ventricosus]